LVPVRHVEHMVRHETNARVQLNPKMHHADFLFSPATQERILAEFAEVRGCLVCMHACCIGRHATRLSTTDQQGVGIIHACM
jgi:hypothetical protein